jgi:hypothetical protein
MAHETLAVRIFALQLQGHMRPWPCASLADVRCACLGRQVSLRVKQSTAIGRCAQHVSSCYSSLINWFIGCVFLIRRFRMQAAVVHRFTFSPASSCHSVIRGSAHAFQAFTIYFL